MPKQLNIRVHNNNIQAKIHDNDAITVEGDTEDGRKSFGYPNGDVAKAVKDIKTMLDYAKKDAESKITEFFKDEK